jgi:hypothetical protein
MEEERTWLFMQDGATTHTVGLQGLRN